MLTLTSDCNHRGLDFKRFHLKIGLKNPLHFLCLLSVGSRIVKLSGYLPEIVYGISIHSGLHTARWILGGLNVGGSRVNDNSMVFNDFQCF